MPRDCPVCQKTLARIRRKPWMHRIPGSKHYVCRDCGHAYLLVLNRWLLKCKPPPPKPGSAKGS